ncbi:hypothetical protein BpHYR1_015306 [Brachionus plicatilis]|uniref:Uncharacterized protein n=1 Tax=Brachionus plicatilis TaxID=10195 RepID=A0A3M7RZG0_BRAPC|nr:hypothetical protein BpHYR1_015306 [Brachionus plicatilis]
MPKQVMIFLFRLEYFDRTYLIRTSYLVCINCDKLLDSQDNFSGKDHFVQIMTPFMMCYIELYMMENTINEKSRSKKKCLLFVLFNVYLNLVRILIYVNPIKIHNIKN